MAKTAKVAVEKTTYGFDRLFAYRIPDHLSDTVKPGCRVVVPFSRGNAKRQAMCFSVSEQPAAQDDEPVLLKDILYPVDFEPVLSGELLKLAAFLKKTTFCTYYEAVKAILPPGLAVSIAESYRLAPGKTAARPDLTEEQRQAVESLLAANTDRKREAAVEKILSSGKKGRDLLETLRQKGVLLPDDGLHRRVGESSMQMVSLSAAAAAGAFVPTSKKQEITLAVLEELGETEIGELCYMAGVSRSVVETLSRRGGAEIHRRTILRTPYRGEQTEDPAKIALSSAQEAVCRGLAAQYAALAARKRQTAGAPAEALTQTPSAAAGKTPSEPVLQGALLYGVTGSGKTHVFIKLIEQVVKDGRQAVMLVPEISLTPQMVAKFTAFFGEKIAVLHSGLSLGERLDEWTRIKNGQAQIVIGTRSAVFAPCSNIGLMILDEEGEASYKSEQAPRYHARTVAKYRCKQHGALLLLASATPSVESFYKAKKGVYAEYTLTERFAGAALPRVEIVDLCQEDPAPGGRVLSDVLADAIRNNLAAGEQSILLLNRRGFHTFASCMSCRAVLGCPRCSVKLTYHKANGLLMCHACGYTRPLPEVCPECGARHIRLAGLGTQKIEEELTVRYPGARILRMDGDTARLRAQYEEKLQLFASGAYDIMVGTQMVAKGLDFANVTLVGVVTVDNLLYAADFRSMERTFSLLTQVVGRGGRGKKAGRAYIQTYTPQNPVIALAAKQDYVSFYQDELATRRALFYPPFCDVCVIGVSAPEEKAAAAAAKRFAQMVKARATERAGEIPLKMLGPVPAEVYKINNKYRLRLVLKCRANAAFYQFMSALLKEALSQREFDGVSLYADVGGEIN